MRQNAITAPRDRVMGAVLGAAIADPTGKILFHLLIVLVVAKLTAELAERASVPVVAAEILAGIAIGPSLVGIVQPGDGLNLLAELGLIVLMLEVGMQTDLHALKAVRSSALSVAAVGVAAPFAGGIIVCSLFGLDRNQTLFVASALTATSVGVSARVFGELRRLATIEALARSPSAPRIQRELAPVGLLLMPVFFLQVGINVDASELMDAKAFGFAAVVIVVAIIDKTIAGWAAKATAGDRLIIGLGMVPRGEVGLIFASVGLTAGVLAQREYTAILLMVLVTTLIAPPLLSWRVMRLDGTATIEPAQIENPEPMGGWLIAADERISVAGSPGQEHLLAIAVPAALAMAEGRTPDDELVGWLHRTAPTAAISWTAKSTSSFLRLLEFGTPRSWRFLETTGVLQVALPELASAMLRRRSDPLLLDPIGVDRFPALEKVRSLRRGIVDQADGQAAVRSLALLDHPERIMLAALLVDCCGEDLVRAQAVLERLCLEPAVLDEAGALVINQRLLIGTAIRPDGLTAESVLRLAVHLGDEQRATALYVLTIAVGGLERWQRAALEELHSMLSLALAGQRHGAATAAILEQRRWAVRELALASSSFDPALLTGTGDLDRIDSAPISYLLTADPEVVVRHLSLLSNLVSNLGRRGRFVAMVNGPDASGTWHVDLGARDAIGLLARTTGVLEELGLTIDEASIATWTDGAAVQTFAVKPVSTFLPNAQEIERDMALAFQTPLRSGPVPDAVIRFDNSGSPWHTLCEVRATDRPGLLHAIAVAFASVGVDVHGARISTADELVFDMFELTQAGIGKLTATTQNQVSALLRSGVSSDMRRRARFPRNLGG